MGAFDSTRSAPDIESASAPAVFLCHAPQPADVCHCVGPAVAIQVGSGRLAWCGAAAQRYQRRAREIGKLGGSDRSGRGMAAGAADRRAPMARKSASSTRRAQRSWSANAPSVRLSARIKAAGPPRCPSGCIRGSMSSCICGLLLRTATGLLWSSTNTGQRPAHAAGECLSVSPPAR